MKNWLRYSSLTYLTSKSVLFQTSTTQTETNNQRSITLVFLSDILPFICSSSHRHVNVDVFSLNFSVIWPGTLRVLLPAGLLRVIHLLLIRVTWSRIKQTSPPINNHDRLLRSLPSSRLGRWPSAGWCSGWSPAGCHGDEVTKSPWQHWPRPPLPTWGKKFTDEFDLHPPSATASTLFVILLPNCQTTS